MIITGPSPDAVKWGEQIALAGGNVVDVAVGTVLALSVTSPFFAALGGGGFALVKVGPRIEALDYREVGPGRAKPAMFQGLDAKTSQTGGLAVAVPGLPAGLWALHQRHGRWPWRRLFAEPLRLAEEGFRVSGSWVERTNENADRFSQPGGKYFVPRSGLLKPGQKIRQPQLAKALRRFRDHGEPGFYQGIVAQDIVETVNKNGGILSAEDLKAYRVRWLEPARTVFRGHDVSMMPLPSSGGIVLSTLLGLTERIDLPKEPALSVDELHLLVEVLKRGFRSRSLLGDAGFSRYPFGNLLAPDFLDGLAKSISKSRARDLEPLDEKKFFGTTEESTETTHITVMDRSGQTVAMTFTLNEDYGSGVVSERFGIALNNEMDDFTTQPGKANLFGLKQGLANVVQPGKRPLSSMTPTIVEKNGKTIMALGAPGGPRIISGVYQTLYRVLVSGRDIDTAIQSPRVHHQFSPNTVFIDADRLAPETIQGLEKRGHKVTPSWMARVNGIVLKPDGILEGAFDSRTEGAAAGF
jgi:gamma-glutamyltranspeptidase/glutathione hydrolase